MTSTTHPRHPHRIQPTLSIGALRRVVAMPARFGHRLGAGMSNFGSSGQLGPSVEKEIGRWTGGRT
jgi:hypothetical protein